MANVSPFGACLGRMMVYNGRVMRGDFGLPTRIGRYELVEEIARGGMGAVWRAQHVELGTPAALKLMDPSVVDSQEMAMRFRREAQAAASLRGPNIVQIFDFGVEAGIPYIAMELLEGESLGRRLVRTPVLHPEEVGRLLWQVGRGLARAHAAGIVHRDLKPDNIFIVEEEGVEVAKLLDFGIAKRTLIEEGGAGWDALEAGPDGTRNLQTRSGALLGTPHYMSPEQASGRRAVDHRSDVWALGVIAYECLLGRRPFTASNLGGVLLAICTDPAPVPSSVGPVPPGFDRWFACATARVMEERFGSVRDQVAELASLCGVMPPRDSLIPSRSSRAVAQERRSAANTELPSSVTVRGASAGGHRAAVAVSESGRPSTERLGWLVGSVALVAILVGVWGLEQCRAAPTSQATAVATDLAGPGSSEPPTKRGAVSPKASGSAAAMLVSVPPTARDDLAPVPDAAPRVSDPPRRPGPQAAPALTKPAVQTAASARPERPEDGGKGPATPDPRIGF